MLNNRHFSFLLLLLLLAGFSPGLRAQGLEMTVGDANGQAGTDVTVDVSVKNFNAIFNYQGTVVYDDNVLEFVSVASPQAASGVVNIDGQPGPTNTIASNKFTFLFTDPNGVGVTLLDDAVVMTITFRIKAGVANGTASTVTIDGSETSLGFGEAITFTFGTYPVTDGTVTVGNAAPVCDLSFASSPGGNGFACAIPPPGVPNSSATILPRVTSVSGGLIEFTLDSINWFSGTQVGVNLNQYEYIFDNLPMSQTPNAANQFKVIARRVGGDPNCTVSQIFTLFTIPAPYVAPDIVGPSEYCAGEGGVILAAEPGGEAYLWSTGETTQTIVAPAGTYTYTIKFQVGTCGSTSPSFTVTEKPTVANTDNVTICSDATPYTFGTQSLSTSGTYTEVFTAANGCDSTVTLTLTVNPAPVLTALTPVICESDAASVDLTTFQSAITSSAGSFSWSIGGAMITDLFISEYVEGSSNNKYIEIYNGTGADVDLSNYELRLFTNGSTSAGNTNVLSGILADGDVVVYSNSGASIYLGTTINATAVGFNGDDAIGLFNTATNTYADIFGHIGEDPGSEWDVNGNMTQNQTLVRNPGVSAGVSSSSVGFPELGTEWTQFAQDDVSNLGSHTVNSSGGGAIADPTDVAIVDGDVITVTVTDGSCSASTTLSFSVNPSFAVTDTETICDDQLPFAFGTQNLTAGGTYTETFT
ncbi:MAG: cohesin domain-containing protein, partial [Bacteroidota bacterium]